jgi:hypothetical protein
MKNLKYIALGIIVGYLTPYILTLLQAQNFPSSHLSQKEKQAKI